MREFRCTNCEGIIEPFERYLPFENEVLCSDCVENLMEEYDPDGDLADMYYDDSKFKD